jgi:hypothetical protein
VPAPSAAVLEEVALATLFGVTATVIWTAVIRTIWNVPHRVRVLLRILVVAHFVTICAIGLAFGLQRAIAFACGVASAQAISIPSSPFVAVGSVLAMASIVGGMLIGLARAEGSGLLPRLVRRVLGTRSA